MDGSLEFTCGGEINGYVPIQEFYKDLQNDIRKLKTKLSDSGSEYYDEKQEELVQKKDQLIDFEKGRLVGQMIGKYGSEILSAKYSTKALGAYRELKKANQLLTLEALASQEQTQSVLSAAGKRWDLRQ